MKDLTKKTKAELLGWPRLPLEKVSSAEYEILYQMANQGKALQRLSCLKGMLMKSQTQGEQLPDIITHNELKLALEHLLPMRRAIDDVTEMLIDLCDNKEVEK